MLNNEFEYGLLNGTSCGFAVFENKLRYSKITPELSWSYAEKIDDNKHYVFECIDDAQAYLASFRQEDLQGSLFELKKVMYLDVCENTLAPRLDTAGYPYENRLILVDKKGIRIKWRAEKYLVWFENERPVKPLRLKRK